VEILIITSRETRRFIIPKGWPIKGMNDAEAAAKEAYEEAGITGKVKHKPIGRYSYWKRFARNFELVPVDVYPLRVKAQLPAWPEQDARQQAWLAPDDAATLIDEPELASLVRNFAG